MAPTRKIFQPKMHNILFGDRAPPGPTGGLVALPKSLAGFKGHTSEGSGGEERGRRCGEVKGGR